MLLLHTPSASPPREGNVFWSCLSFVRDVAYYKCPPASGNSPGREGSKSSTTEFMQNRFPVGGGPSSNRCPRCPPHRAAEHLRPAHSMRGVGLAPKNSGLIGDCTCSRGLEETGPARQSRSGGPAATAGPCKYMPLDCAVTIRTGHKLSRCGTEWSETRQSKGQSDRF